MAGAATDRIGDAGPSAAPHRVGPPVARPVATGGFAPYIAD